MSAPSVTHDIKARRHGTLRLLLVAAVVIVGVLLAANAHLVYVAFSSQPDCVAHLKGEGEPGTFRAAKSAC
jgi:hypothetical protein